MSLFVLLALLPLINCEKPGNPHLSKEFNHWLCIFWGVFFFATMLRNSARLRHVLAAATLALLVSTEPNIFFCFVNEGQH